MKKMLSLVLILSLCVLSFNSTGHAIKDKKIEVPEEDAYYNEEFDAYVIPFTLDEKGNVIFHTEEEEKKYKDDNNIVEAKDFEDAKNIDSLNVLKSENSIPEYIPDDPMLGPIGGYIDKYYRWGTSLSVGSAVKISADMKGPGYISVNQGVTRSSYFSISLSTSEKSKVKGSAGFTWVNSATSSLTYKMDITDSRTAAIYFKPYYNRTYGYLRHINTITQSYTEKYVQGYSPVKLGNGTLDGYYYLVYK